MRKKVITRLCHVCVKPGSGTRTCFGPRNSKIVYQNSRLSTIPTFNMIKVNRYDNRGKISRNPNLLNLYNQLTSKFIAAKLPSLAFTMTFCMKLIIVTALYSCCLTCLLLLTLSTRIFCLKDLTLTSFSICGTALDWFRSYLTNRTQFALIVL